MANLSTIITGQTPLGGATEKNYVQASDAPGTLWVASGAGVAVSLETTAANLPEASKKSAIKILRASGSDYVRYRFVLDKVDGSKTFKIQWAQSYAGVAGDYTLSVLSYTDANYSAGATTLPVTVSNIPAVNGVWTVTFNTPAYGTAPYIELRINAIAGTTPLYISGVLVGPGITAQSAVVSEPQAVSFTGTWITNTTYTAFETRQGSWGQYDVKVTVTGAPTSTSLILTMPPGRTINLAALANNTFSPSTPIPGQSVTVLDVGTATYDGQASLVSASTIQIVYLDANAVYQGVTQAAPMTFASGDTITISFRVPIAEWAGSGTVTLSTGAIIEYASGAITADANTTATIFGPNGSLVPTATLTTSRYAEITWQYPKQSDDVLFLEIDPTGNGNWLPYEAHNNGSFAYSNQGAVGYGMFMTQPSASQTRVYFSIYATPAQTGSTYAAAGTAWSSFTTSRWRIRKAKASAPVGIDTSALGSGSGGGGSGFILSLKTSNFTAASLNHYLVDTSAIPITATLPAGSTSAAIKFSDDQRTWSIQPLTITTAIGEKIDGQAINEQFVCDVSGATVQLSWDGQKWVLDSNVIQSTVSITTGNALTEKNYVVRPDSAATDWLTSNAAQVTVATESVASNLPENATKTSAIRIIRAAGTTSYVYTRFVLDSVDTSKKLKLQWNQKFSGVAGDFTIALYSFTASDYSAGATQLTSLQTSTVPALSSGTFITSFDAPASTAPYIELRIIAAAGITPLYLSGVLIGPGVITQGAVVSDWQTYAPLLRTSTGAAITLNTTGYETPSGRWRRVGDSMEVQASFRNGSGAASAASGTDVTWSLPSGYTVNTSALTSASGGWRVDGFGAANNIGKVGNAFYYGTNPGSPSLAFIDSTTNNWLALSAITAGVSASLRATIPIAEWAGNGTLNVSSGAAIEYAWNNTATATVGVYSTNFGYGPAGTPILNYSLSASAAASYQVQFQYPIQTDDILSLEIHDGTGAWVQYSQRLGGFSTNDAGTTTYGAVVRSISSPNNNIAQVDFYTAPFSGLAWSAVTSWRWRVRKSKASSPVGIAAATQDSLGLIKLSQISGAGEKNYLSTGSSDGSGWAVSGPGIAVGTESTAVNLPENATKTSALRVLRSSGSDYARTRFVLDAADYNKKLKIQWNQKYLGTSGDYTVRIFSNTASDYTGTSTELLTTNPAIPALTGTYVVNFDSSGSVAPYLELRITGLSGTTALYLSGIVVGPGVNAQGVALSDWQSYTPTFSVGVGAATLINFWYRRVGSDMEIVGSFSTGTLAASIATFTLPSNLTTGSSQTLNRTFHGTWFAQTTPTNLPVFQSGGIVISTAFGANTIGFDYQAQNSTNVFTPRNGATLWNNNTIITVNCRIPIAEWAGNGTISIGQGAQIEYLSHDGTTATRDWALIPNIAGAANNTTYTLTPQYPCQSDDILEVELREPGNAVLSNGAYPWIQGTSSFMFGIQVRKNANGSILAIFGNAGFSPALGLGAAATGNTWADFRATGWQWRIRKAKQSSPVGFGAATQNDLGLVKLSQVATYAGNSYNYCLSPNIYSSAASSSDLGWFNAGGTVTNISASLPKESLQTALQFVSTTTGDYLRYRFKIDDTDLSRRLQILFSEIATFGDFKLEVYSGTDAALSSPQLIIVQSIYTDANGITNLPTGTTNILGNFDTTSRQYYEVRWTALAAAKTLKISGVNIGSGSQNSLQAIDSRISPSYTFEGMTPATRFDSQRNINWLKTIGWFDETNPLGTTAAIVLPSGMTIDTTLLSNGGCIVGSWKREYTGTASPLEPEQAIAGFIFYDGTTANKLFFCTAAGAGSFVKRLGTEVGNGDDVSIEFTVPILEWSNSSTVSAINPISQSPIRAGIIMPFAGPVTPAGWLDADGTAYPRVQFPQLFAQIGTTWDTAVNPLTGVAQSAPAGTDFRVPHLQGAFIRGAGGGANSAGVTTTLAGFQADRMANHTHPITVDSLLTTQYNRYGTNSPSTVGQPPGIDFNAQSHFHSGSSTTQVETGVESRPDNQGVRYIIKAWDESFNLAGFAEATATNLGLSYRNRFQRKQLTANLTSDGPINEWSFSNLTIGKVYQLDISSRMVHISSVDNWKQGIITVTHGGSTSLIYGPWWNVNAMQSGDQYPQSTTRFVAIGTTITMSWSALNLQLWAPGYASLTELNDTEATNIF